jgi:hypothetical protein
MKYIVDQNSRFETVPANTRLLVTSEGIIIPAHSYARDGYIYSMEYPLGRFIRRTQVQDIPAKEDAVFTSFSKSWNIEKAHDWVYLWSSLTVDDTNYRPGLHCNGGAYQFHTERRFFARIQGDDIKFCYLDVHKTSSEFGYCGLTGQFCNELVPIWFQGMDNEPEICMNVQEARNLNLEVGDNYWEGCPLDRVATVCEFKDVWNSSYIVITGDVREEFPPCMREKKDRIRLLKALGVMTKGEYKREVVKYHRANRERRAQTGREERLSLRKSAEELARILDNL